MTAARHVYEIYIKATSEASPRSKALSRRSSQGIVLR